MHIEILNRDQLHLLPLISSFKNEYYLVDGTAIALYIGHRRSIDFDLFKYKSVNHKKNLTKLDDHGVSYHITRRVADQMNLIINNVKVTFFQYPFEIKAIKPFDSYISLPTLLDLGAMKAYALGRWSKWKDYVDLYFILKEFCSIRELSSRARDLFGELFSEKLFRSQLSYFDDIDFTEGIEYIVNNPPTDEEIMRELTILAATIFE